MDAKRHLIGQRLWCVAPSNDTASLVHSAHPRIAAGKATLTDWDGLSLMLVALCAVRAQRCSGGSSCQAQED